jgi:hypothetical protein
MFQVVAEPADRSHVGDARHDPELGALNQVSEGPVRQAFDRLKNKSLFSYGIAHRRIGLKLIKPDGSTGLVDFQYLTDHAPEPFKSGWSGGQGITIHHKLVVRDFNLPTTEVLAGSSNLFVSGEEGNGDHLSHIVSGRDDRMRSTFSCRSRSRAACDTDTPRLRTSFTASSLNSRLNFRRCSSILQFQKHLIPVYTEPAAAHAAPPAIRLIAISGFASLMTASAKRFR